MLILNSLLTAQNININCLSVSDEGAVYIEWHNISNDFVNGKVWYKDEYMTDFESVYSFNNPIDSFFNHSDAGANYKRTTYFISNQLTSETIYSDTLNTYFVTSELIDNTHIKLTWNKLREDQELFFYIDREEDNVWYHAFQSDTNYFVDNISRCVSDYRYRIHSVTECIKSNATIPLIDETAPIAPHFDSVSIINNQYVALGWQRSVSTDAAGYRIYKKQPLGWDVLMEIDNPDILFAIDSNFTTFCEEERTYCIVTVDKCRNSSPINESQQIHNLVLNPPILDICEKNIILNWLPYEMHDLTPQLGGYQIWVSQNGDAFQLETTIPPNATFYNYNHPERNSNYIFKIQAINNLQTVSTSSCEYQIYANLPKEPDYGFIRYASVNNGFVDLCFEIDTQTSSPSYQLLRSTAGINGPFQIIKNLSPTGENLICTTDSVVDIKNYSYYYKFQTLDSCLHIFEAPLIARNILLSTLTNNQSKIELQWIDYDGFINDIDKYLIYRKIDYGQYELIDNTVDSIYVDDSREAENFQVSLWYRVAAVSNDSIPDTAWSNFSQFELKSFSVFFPNAFKPNGSINNIFKPVYAGIIATEFQLVIYNRWGEQIFSTTNVNDGWNGKTKNGSDCETGPYAYHFLMTDIRGNRYQKTGSVILLK